jgi:flagellar biosynthetic protein FlhB
MAGGSAQEKTEQPTGKRLSQARQRGQIPKSRDLTMVIVLMGGVYAIFQNANRIFDNYRVLVQELWGEGFHVMRGGGFLGSDGAVSILRHLGAMVGPVVLTAAALAVTVTVFQTKGIVISLQPLSPSFSKINPLAGMKRVLISPRALMEILKSFIKLAIVIYVSYGVLRSEYQVLPQLCGRGLPEIIKVIGELSSKIVLRVGVAIILLGILDLRYQKWQHMKELKMTKQEVKEEAKQADGNPQVKSRQRSIMRAMNRKRMMKQVPKATVVITNPTHYAVALLYKQEMAAPQLLAKGMNLVALKIIKIARENGVPVHQNPPLARALYQQVKLEESIPVELYRAVAKVLAYIYQQRKRGMAR